MPPKARAVQPKKAPKIVAAKNSSTAHKEPRPRQPRQRLSQLDVPAFTLADALQVAEVLRDQYAKQPTIPLDVATAMDVSPNSSNFKMLTGASVAYGLTEGAAQAELISLTPLGRRIVAPTEEGDDVLAMREAALNPRVVHDFLQKYNGSPLPSESIALNVIEGLGVPSTATKRALEMILANAEALGLLVEIKGKRYVRLEQPSGSPSVQPIKATQEPPATPTVLAASPTEAKRGHGTEEDYDPDEAPAIAPHRPAQTDVSNSRVFITHGRNAKIVEQLKKILVFGRFEPIVSVDRQTVAKPLPDKVMDDMRSCGAAIVHVGLEQKLLDAEGAEHSIVNQNVLIEIGAAMALYGRRFILLVERGLKLPSNLQGLYEVRYEGDQLDHDATMKLLEAFNDFR